MLTTIDVVVPVQDDAAQLRAVLFALSQQTDSNFRTIVSDGGGQVAVQNVLSEFSDKLDIVHAVALRPGNVFHRGKIRNAAIPLSKADRLLFIAADLLLVPEAVSIHKEYGSDLTFITGIRFLVPEEIRNDLDLLRTDDGQKKLKQSQGTLRTDPDLLQGRNSRASLSLRGYPFPRGFQTSYPRRLLLSSGGFWEPLRVFEDIHLAWRMCQYGCEWFVRDDAIGYHLQPVPSADEQQAVAFQDWQLCRQYMIPGVWQRPAQRRIFGIGLPGTACSSLAALLTEHSLPAEHCPRDPRFIQELLACRFPWSIFTSFDNLTGAPLLLGLPQLLEAFPDADYVYLTRDLDSWLDYMLRAWQDTPFPLSPELSALRIALFGRCDQLPSRAQLAERYKYWDAYVRQEFQQARVPYIHVQTPSADMKALCEKLQLPEQPLPRVQSLRTFL